MDEETLAELTEPQRQAVMHIDGPLLVLAGPGSGKTRVITYRIAYLVQQGIPAWQILALTFTNKAAGEMRQRIDAIVPADVPGRRGLTVATFHSFSARMLRRYAQQAGLSPRFTIYDEADRRDAIKRALKDVDLSASNWTPASVGGSISNAKNQLIDCDTFAAQATDFHARSIAKAYRAYEQILRSNDALDFDDLLVHMASLLRERQDVREEFQRRYQYILIDEYQDTNHSQFVIAHTLAASHRNICVVGDPDQSIYAWRGADIRNILEFEEQYPNAKVIALGKNFRSTGHIVSAAGALIRNNRRRKDKKLHTDLGEGEKPRIITAGDEHHEARLIVEELQALHRERNLPWREMAVLYRINALSRVIEDELRRSQVPYLIVQGTAFYERKEIKDALAYLRLIVNPNDEVALRRIINTPTRGIGNTTLDRVELFAINRQLRLSEALRAAVRVEGLGERAATAIRRFVAMVDGWRQAASAKGANTLALDIAQDDAGLGRLVDRVIRESGLDAMFRKSKSEEDEQRLANLEELVSAAAEFIPAVDDEAPSSGPESVPARTTLDLLAAFLESVALVSDADAVDPTKGAVTLMTLHAAKGLEFDAVTIVGLEEGLLPHMRALGNELELEEERRLCYVGMTRARRHLALTHTSVRTLRGMREARIGSQFLRELPEQAIELIDRIGTFDPWEDDGEGDDADSVRCEPVDDDPRVHAGVVGRAGGSNRRSGGSSARFPVGSLVRHPTFGLGRVESIMPRASGAAARISFNTAGTKTLILEYAKLERVT